MDRPTEISLALAKKLAQFCKWSVKKTYGGLLLKVSLPVVVIPLKHRLLTVNYWPSNTTVVEHNCAQLARQLSKPRGLICKRDVDALIDSKDFIFHFRSIKLHWFRHKWRLLKVHRLHRKIWSFWDNLFLFARVDFKLKMKILQNRKITDSRSIFNIHYSKFPSDYTTPIKISRALRGCISLIHRLIPPNLQGSLNTNFNTFPPNNNNLVD